VPACGAPSSHYGGWRADPPERPKAADTVEQRFSHFQEILREWGSAVQRGLCGWWCWRLELATTGARIIKPPTRCPNDTPSVRIKSLSVTSPALGPPLNTHCTTLEGPAAVRISNQAAAIFPARGRQA
jgi:hypothetical protein